MPRDLVIIPAKGLASGKSRLASMLSPHGREHLNRFQLQQTVRAASIVFGAQNTYVVSACARVAGIVASEGVGFIAEQDPGLNEALEHARSTLVTGTWRSISVLPVDLPCVGDASLRELLHDAAWGEAMIVPDRAGQGTNFLRLPAGCDIPFAYGQGSFARHLSLFAQAAFVPRVVEQTCLRDDLDDPVHLQLHRPCAGLLAA